MDVIIIIILRFYKYFPDFYFLFYDSSVEHQIIRISFPEKIQYTYIPNVLDRLRSWVVS